MKQAVQIDTDNVGNQTPGASPNMSLPGTTPQIAVSLLTGGGDKPYAFGLATELVSKGATLDVIGSDDLDFPELHGKPRVKFLNLRGDQRPDASVTRKVLRVSLYYAKLIGYAATAQPRIFHILWNNKIELVDRTLLMLYYRFLGKKTVLTLHNVNSRKRDSKDSALNRLTLRIQYRLADHIFVHTDQMKRELAQEFGVQGSRVSVIPFGINNAAPRTQLTASEARQRLGIRENERAILFFGNIAPYKGLEYLIAAFQEIAARRSDYRLIIAGWPKNCADYWRRLQETIYEGVYGARILVRAEFIPDEETEVYFKAADILVLPYRYIYQSGILFLGYSFGLPVLVADVGSLKDEIVEGKTGFVFRSEDPVDLAAAVERYFASDLFANINVRRQEIQDFAGKQHSWDVVGRETMRVYAALLHTRHVGELSDRDASKASLDMKTPT